MNQKPAVQNSTAITLKDKRSLAKTGMIVSMGALVATGFMGNRESSVIHVGSGLALVGFAYWHYKLYEPQNSKIKR